MKFTSVVVAALAAVVSAKPKFTNSNFDVVAGQAFELKWTDAKGPVTIELKAGTSPKDLKTFSVLATGVSGTSFTVTVPKDVPSGQYAFTVADGPTDNDTNYSVAFALVGTGSSSSSSSRSVASSTSSRSTSSSATSSATTMTTTSATSNSSTATTSSGSTSTRASSTPSSTPTTTGTIPNSNSSGNKVQSSLALVMLGAVAYAFLN